MQKRGGRCGARLGLPLSLSAEVFGGKNSVKGNRQGSLSRWIKRLFETFLEFQKVQQPVENTFSTGWGGRGGARPSFAVRPAVGAFLQGGGRFIQRLFTHL